LADRPRVLNVAYSTAVWGAEQTILRLAPLLAARDIDVMLAAPPGGPLEAAWTGTGLPFVPIDVPDHGGIRRRGKPPPHGRWPAEIVEHHGAAQVVNVGIVAVVAAAADDYCLQRLGTILPRCDHQRVDGAP